MLWIAILLDVIITVLFVKIPYNHSSYSKLFGNPIFWILVAENIFIITHDVEKVFGRKAKDFSDFARETAATGIWNVLTPNFAS